MGPDGTHTNARTRIQHSSVLSSRCEIPFLRRRSGIKGGNREKDKRLIRRSKKGTRGNRIRGRIAPTWGGIHPQLTTQQGQAISDDETRSRHPLPHDLARCYWKTLFFGRRSTTSIMSVFRSALSMRGARQPTASLNSPTPWRSFPRQECSVKSEKKSSICAFLDRGRKRRFLRYGARRARICSQALYEGRQLGPGGKQHPGFLHPRRDQISGSDPCCEARAG